MQNAWEELPGWSELLEEFRRLGGTADNVRMGRGVHGRGLFAEDPARPVQLHAPPNLLLPIDDVLFKDGRFHVSESAKMGSAEKAWLEHYENEFSWGRGGRDEAAAFLEGMHSLPMHIREKLAQTFGLDYCTHELSADLMQKRFLNSRVARYDDRRVVMPMIELVNHGGGPTYDCTNGIAVRGNFADEVLVSYCGLDAFGLFGGWGFVCDPGFALSITIRLQDKFGEIIVMHDVANGEIVEITLQRPMRVRVPRLVVDGGKITLSFLLLGWKGFPRMPKGIFRRVLRDAGRPEDDEPFEMLQRLNRAAFLGLLKDLEGVEGPMAASLRQLCLIQLDALNQSYGARPI